MHRINVTPIIDVALVLVIILLITAPMIAVTEMDINLPAARTRSLEDEVRVNITLGKDGEIGLDDRFVSPQRFLESLRQRIEEADSDNILVVVRADETTPHGTVREVIKSARSAGAKRIAIATRQRGNL
jgi:biopolymer transport protein ExbD